MTDAAPLPPSPAAGLRRRLPRWLPGARPARAAPSPGDGADVVRRAVRDRTRRAFPATAAELAQAGRFPVPPPTGVVVLGHGPVVADGGVLLDDGPLCVPCDAEVTIVAPPVLAAAWARALCDQSPWSGGTPTVRRAASVAEALATGGTVVVLESSGEAWARRPGHPGERVPLTPVLPAAPAGGGG